MSYFQNQMRQSVNAPVSVVVSGVSAESLFAQAETLSAESLQLANEVNFFAGQASSLEALADQMGESLGQGGLTPQAAGIAATAAQGIMRSFGMEDLEVVASNEAFGGVSDRESATEASIESIKTMASNAWDTIVKMIRDWIRKAKVFFTKLMDAAPKIKKRAEALSEKAGGLTGDAKNKTISLGSDAAKLATDKAVVPATVVGAMKDLEFVSGDIVTVATDKDGAARPIGEGIANSDLSKLDAAAGIVRNGLTATGAAANARWAGVKVTVTDLPLGNKVIVRKFPETVPEVADQAKVFQAGSRLAISLEDKTKDFSHIGGDYDAPVLSIAQIGSLADGVVGVAASLEKSKKGIEDGYKTQDGLAKSIENMKKVAGKLDEDDKAKKPIIDAFVTCCQKQADFIRTQNDIMTKYSIGTALAALNYAEKSAGQYKG